MIFPYLDDRTGMESGLPEKTNFTLFDAGCQIFQV